MNTFRKILAAALLVSLVLCSACAVADTELNAESETKSASASVVLDLGEQPTSYTVIIPSQIDLDPTTGKGSATVTLKSGFVLTDITGLYVYLSDGFTESYHEGYSDARKAYMTLKNVSNASKVTCWITSSKTNYIQKESLLIGVSNKSGNAADLSCTLNLSVEEKLPYGKYTGTLTFSIKTANG